VAVAEAAEPYHLWQNDSLLLSCRLQTKATQDGFAEVVAGRIKIRITAAPVDGMANKHLIKFLAKQFKVPQERIAIMSGEHSKHKRILIRQPQSLPVLPALFFPDSTQNNKDKVSN
jgi:uncharacterized protein (TIGR00251 family)